MPNWKSPLRIRISPLLLALIAVNAVLALAASAQTPPAAPVGTNQQVYQAKGVIQELKPDGKTVRIKHEDIPGYMGAMTMDFEAKDTNNLTGLRAGDAVTFQLVVTPKEGWIDHVTKTGVVQISGGDVASTRPFIVLRDREPLNVGDSLPDYHFTNELGQAVSTAQFKGQALVFTFFFTRCPFPNFCPFLANGFAETQKKLLAQNNGPTNWHLLSISFDPEHDSPATLKSYAGIYKYDPAHWTFATGDLTEIMTISSQVGEFFTTEGANITHNLRTVVVDAQGRVQKIIVGNTWTSDELVAEIVKAARAKP
jgi:protein SCO1